MGNGFTLDEEQALNYMTRSTIVNDATMSQTVYAVVCHHSLDDGVGSHGGAILEDSAAAIKFAKRLNDRAPEDHQCTYVPVALGLPLDVALRIADSKRQVPPDDRV